MNYEKFFALSLIIFVACQPSKEFDSGALKEEVMAIHDEVMPKMGELRKVRKAVMLLADSLMQINPDSAAMLTALADNIEGANEGMMQWMREYEPDYEGTEEEIKVYLEKQKEAIERVKAAMDSSLAEGLKALEQN